MILQAKIIKETDKATLFHFYNEKELIYKTSWIPNSVIIDIEIDKKDIIEVDIADWFCKKEGLDCNK